MVRTRRSITDRSQTRLIAGLLCGSALIYALPTHAQVTITDAITTPVNTSTAGDEGGESDVTIGSGGSITLTDEGPAVILDSDNELINQGTIAIEDVDNATGVLLEGGANRSFTNSGSITISESFAQEDTDDDPFADTPPASGSGRTGILVSGASPFQGNISLDTASQILIEGNESFGVDLSNTPVGEGLDGNLTNDGSITMFGDNGAAVRIAGGVTGDVSHSGGIAITGSGSSAFDIGADIGGGFTSSGTISNNGFRFPTRAGFNPDAQADRTDLTAEDLGLAGSAINISGNIARGINLTSQTIQNSAGTEFVTLSNITQTGSAPAILLDGNGTPIMIGTVSAITDPNADGFDEDLLYGFINLGTVSAQGVYDDFDATVLSIADTTIDGGILNQNSLTAQTFVGAIERPIDGVDLGTGLARVIVLGDNAIAERIQNDGLIIARASEATDEVYFDPANLPAPRPVTATAIDIGANATVENFFNDGTVQAILIGREGTATVVSDASGTLSNIINRGNIQAIGSTSDQNNQVETDFTLIAFDLSNNTTGVDFLQELAPDSDPNDDVSPLPPVTAGDILLGSGDDNFVSTSGLIVGDIAFGAGNDSLTLTDTFYDGSITNSDDLVIEVVNSSVTVRTGEPIDITSASFDETSSFSPLVDGSTGLASTLQATGAISFANGTTITPIFTNLVNAGLLDNTNTTNFNIAVSDNLSVADIDALNAGDDGSFLFDTTYGITGNTLVVTVDLREATALGLDPTQLGVGESVFGATLQGLQNNSELGDEIANLDTAEEFYAAYNQLLPEIAAAARQFVIANSDGAIGAVANHLDANRRSQDKPGGAWLQQFAYFADRDLGGQSEQYRGAGFGFTGGLDKAVGPFHAVGFNFGFASTEIEDVIGVDDPLDVTTLLAGLYAGYEAGKLGIDAYAGGGWNDFEQNRNIRVGNYASDTVGEWTGTHLTASLRAGYDLDFGKRYWARPVISLDYLRLSENGYTETGDIGVALSVEDRTSESASVTGLMNFGAVFNGERTWIRPSIRVGYRQDFLSDGIVTDYRFANVTDALLASTTSPDFPSSGLLVGFSLAAGSEFSSVGFDFDSDIRDGFIRHTGRIVVRLLF